ncbi:hypothetical protein OFDDKENP_00088 [Aeromonas phage B614]|nr:hypothetical protein OFDDKENP_00088 [Aeromonas phage B614]UYD58185.1 hypothetical protein JNEOFJEA_00088 [Aeromonas phage UP87]UYD58548.1 hypothetical protein IPAKJDPM_00205 [Aeromonas phage avDM14-QBC]UYD58763.1 hypothetical protein HNNIDBEH_00170 [Aeromonas phage avDM10-HWA]UYD58933.1 hypothetical protein OFOPOMKI_00083 [Aeromonas phage avDM7-IJDJ]UYD59992.1 hypothetical protein LEHPIFIF_00236 [Aeromonas phage avDM9-HANS]
MKAICIRKKVKGQKFKRLTPGDEVRYQGARWEVATVCCVSEQSPTVILRKKMSRIHVIIELHNDRLFQFKEISPESITTWVDSIEQSEIKFSGGYFGMMKETEETIYAPIQVGDEFIHNNRGTYRYTVKFIADDGSLIAWDSERGKSIFVNRNDRDQLKAYGMQLS